MEQLPSSSSQLVHLICIKEGSKLRVRITSPNYLPYANCQFPRDIRQEGRRYVVPANCISLIRRGVSYFYSVSCRNQIKIVDELDIGSKPIQISAVYEDENLTECVICMCNEKDVVFAPCCHFYCCSECAKKIKNCPICRTAITGVVHKSQIG